tara:strand:+ start:112 stop:1155 length:1044 start_codon:yes stop_codon:yes gene_type:complete
MAYTTVNKSTAHFNTKLITGNGSTQALTGVGHQPDFIWMKRRNATGHHRMIDTVRGISKIINSDLQNAEATTASYVTAIGLDGWTIGNNSDVNPSGGTTAGWSWKAGTTGSGTTTGSGYGKAYSYSVNTTAGFSIIKYIGNGSAGHTIPHHLGAAPEWILVKDLDATINWQMYHVNTGNQFTTEINITNAPFSSNSRWNNTTPSSTVVTLGDGNNTNNNNTNYIMYAFTPKTGYSKFGEYTGNGNNDGPFIYTGFKPSFVMTIRKDSPSGRGMLDNKRPGYNVTHQYLLANDAQTEATDGSWSMDLLSNGWKARYNNGNFNASGGTYLYMAFGQSLVGTNNVPCTAR